MKNAFENDELPFLESSLQSFDDFKRYQKPFIREPEDVKDFFAFIADKDEAWLKANSEWIWPPNADTDDELLMRANNSNTARPFKNGGGIVGKPVRPGEILFATNRNHQSVYGEGHWHFMGTLTKYDGEPLNIYKTQLLVKGNITIVTLHPNQVAIALSNQKPVILLPGRHCYHDAKFVLTQEDIFTITGKSAPIYHHTITCVRVGDWEVGLGYLEGEATLLKPGLHLSRSTSFQFTRTFDIRELEGGGEHGRRGALTHDNIAIVKVDPKDWGCAVKNGEPVFLKPGLHIYNEPSFSFQQLMNQTTPHIKFQNLHIIQVQSNQIGLAWEGNKPVLIQPGIWQKSSPVFRFDGCRLASEQKIEHGSITRYNVQHGEIGFAWQDGKVKELKPGIEIVDDPNFQFVRTHKLNEPVIQFGNMAFVTTQEAHCRPVYVNGKLVILAAGSERFDEPNLKVKDAFTTGEIIFPLKKVEVMTRDRTPMMVTGQISYQITRPKDLIFNLGYEKLDSSLEQTVHAILRHAFSITDLSTISPDNKVSKALKAVTMEDAMEGSKHALRHDSEETEKEAFPVFRRGAENQEGQNFRGDICHNVQAELVRLTASWGINVKDVAISDIQFKDQAVADKLASATSHTRTAEAEFDLTQAQTRIRLEKAQADAQEQLIVQTNGAKIKKIDAENHSQTKLIQEKALAQAESLKRKQEMETEAQLVMTRTEARASEIHQLAEARAKELTTIARAERDADLLRAEGQKALAEASIVRLSNPNVLQLEMMKLYVEASEYLAKAPTPAVLLQNNSGDRGDDSSGNADMLSLFRNQGKQLLGAAMNGSGVDGSKAKK